MLSLFKKKPIVEDNKSVLKGDIIYNFLVEEFSEIDKIPTDAYDLFYDRKLHGIILKNVLKPEETGLLLDRLKNIPSEKKVFNEKNNLYPRGFASYTEKTSGNEQLDFDLYFSEAKDYIDHFEEHMGVDVPSRLVKIFEHIGNTRKFMLLESGENGGVFPHSQFRTLYPKVGLLPVHSENSLHIEYPVFFNKLSPKALIKDQMSFFIMLQKPEKGGKMMLFDVPYEEGQKMVPVDCIKLKNGKIIDPIKNKSVKKMDLDLNPGDMLLFLGGPI